MLSYRLSLEHQAAFFFFFSCTKELQFFLHLICSLCGYTVWITVHIQVTLSITKEIQASCVSDSFDLLKNIVICGLTAIVCVCLCCIFFSWMSTAKTYLHIFPHRIFLNVLLQSFIAPPVHWGVSHRSIELPYFYSQAWKDCSHGLLLCWLPCLSISIGCLVCSLSSGPLRRRVLVDSKVRGPTWLGGGGGLSWLLWLPAD